jgi:hypothetical protein
MPEININGVNYARAKNSAIIASIKYHKDIKERNDLKQNDSLHNAK